MKLYGADVCPFVHRVRLGLGLKSCEFDYVDIDLGNKPDWYYDVLPSGKVPLLEHEGNRIWESMIILEYLEDVFPERPLYPSEPGDKARARIAIDWFNSTVVSDFYKVLREPGEEPSKTAREHLEELQTEYLGQGPFFAGEKPGMVDIALYPWFARWAVLQHYRDFALQEERLSAWCRRMAGLEVCKSTTPPDDYFIEKYSRYAKEATPA